MPAWLIGLFTKAIPSILDWIWGKIAPLIKRSDAIDALEERQDARLSLAAEVEALRKELLATVAANNNPQRVLELKEKIREKSRELIRS